MQNEVAANRLTSRHSYEPDDYSAADDHGYRSTSHDRKRTEVRGIVVLQICRYARILEYAIRT